MNIFANILEHYFQKNSPVYNEGPCDQIIKQGLINSIRSLEFKTTTELSNKSFISVLKSNILDNNFVKMEQQEYIFSIYSLTMRRFLTLLRFKHKLQLTYGRRYSIDTDLHMNPLSEIHPNLKLTIIQNKTAYQFRLSDLGNIIESSLGNSSDLITMPQWPRNPYTNSPFTKTTLMIIFIAFSNSTLRLPTLFGLFVNIRFDLQLFEVRYEQVTREYSINTLLNNGDIDTQYDFIRDMMTTHETELKTISVHPSFPRAKIVAALKDSLALFLRARYASCFFERSNFRKKTVSSLQRFARLNPYWGRLIIIQPDVTEAERNLSDKGYSVFLISEKDTSLLTQSSDGKYVDIIYTDDKHIKSKKHRRNEIYSIGN